MKRCVLIAFFSFLAGISAYADLLEVDWYWSTRFGRDILAFGANNNLIYQSDYTIDDKSKSYRLFGTWEFQQGVCQSSDKKDVSESTVVKGNLVLYIDSTQCCLKAEFQDNNLILTKIWVEGSGLALHAYCKDNLLMPIKPSGD
jgi:hypothetical protein